MSGKNQAPVVLNWQSTNPATGFLPLNNNTAGKGSAPSGNLLGAMAATDQIWSNIIDVSRMDNIGLGVSWTGTPTGTFAVQGSNDGAIFFDLTFDPALTQPAGSAGSYGIDLNQFPWKYLLLTYTNASGTGSLLTTMQVKDLN